VVEFLNTNFAFMIEAIDRHGGFINKFPGDGFLTIFGAPLDDPIAACHALEAAREILAEIDERGLSDGPWPLRVGIGLHLGSAVTGNVGSPRREEFTAIGDTVNLAVNVAPGTSRPINLTLRLFAQGGEPTIVDPASNDPSAPKPAITPAWSDARVRP
jgi:Adenylate and Guanylate cyclase catalytic domain